MRRESTILKIKEVIRNISPTAKVILFGSQARSEAREDSDIDVLILIYSDKLTYQKKSEFADPLFDLGEEENVMISPIVATFKGWFSRTPKSPFYVNIMKEGIEL